MKKLRKRLLETESTDEVEALKRQMHVAEVDLSYTQYCPLSEPYVSLYSQKSSVAEEDDCGTAVLTPKPAMWAEVEKCLEDGTLDRLRNTTSTTVAVNKLKPSGRRPAKPRPKAKAEVVDTTGMTRRQRRSQRTKDMFAVKTKNKSMAFERNQAFGSTQAQINTIDGRDENDSDGGFFED